MVSVVTFSNEVCLRFTRMLQRNLTRVLSLQVEYIWVRSDLPRPIYIYADMATE